MWLDEFVWSPAGYEDVVLNTARCSTCRRRGGSRVLEAYERALDEGLDRVTVSARMSWLVEFHRNRTGAERQ